VVVAAVGVEAVGSSGWSADRTADGWYRVDERDELSDIVAVPAGQDDQ
jgi:hypothetical protein